MKKKIIFIAISFVITLALIFSLTNEKYYGDIDIYCINEIIDDILNAPVTMEEKLADVGMSIKDFL